MLELGPVLPYSSGAEGTVVVKNPCEFPIEFYSLEFDQQYLAEEQVRRSGPRVRAAVASQCFSSRQGDGGSPHWWPFRVSWLCWQALEELD